MSEAKQITIINKVIGAGLIAVLAIIGTFVWYSVSVAVSAKIEASEAKSSVQSAASNISQLNTDISWIKTTLGEIKDDLRDNK